MAGQIIAEKAGGTGWLVFDNPERHNAVSFEMWEQVSEAMRAFDADDEVRVIVVRGEGGKSFVSGADISKFESERAGQEAVERYEAATEAAYATLENTPKPTIAMIEGYCIGGGTNLALCCDLRIAGENAKFAIPAAKLGLGYGYSRIRRVISVIGPAFAKEIFFTARQFTAGEASAMGLVNRVVPNADLRGFVENYAATIVENAPLTVGAIKQIVGEALKDPADRDLDLCATLVSACFDSEDYVEGRVAFRERRKPIFKGR
jgi:enoyl-CoA hydratase/carnithine racemase